MSETTGTCTCTHTTEIHPTAECIEQAERLFERMDTIGTIAAVLAAHQPAARQDEGGYVIRQGCTCGWNSPRQVGAHRAHLAEQLIESVAPVEFARQQRVAALARLLVAEGHLTPQGKRLIDRALTEEES